MKKPKFSLIICGYNEENNLDLCISSCLNQNYSKEKYEVIYVDNNSLDNSLKVAKKYPIRVLMEKRQGLSEARNCGIKNARGEILVFLDADLRLDKNYLKNHEKSFLEKKVGAGGGKVLPLKETWISNYLGVSLFEGYPRDKKHRFVRTYPGCNLTIRRSVLEEVGNFKEGLKSSEGVTRFAEDKEICERIRNAGHKIIYNPDAIVFHDNISSFRRLANIWIKSAKGRRDMIKLGKTDPFSKLFRWNIPLIYLVLVVSFLFIMPLISSILICAAVFFILSLCIKSAFDTRMFVQSLFIKPWMDALSLVIINIGALYWGFK